MEGNHILDLNEWVRLDDEAAQMEDRARATFDSAEKNQLYLFFDYAPGAYLIQNAELLTAADIDAIRENNPLDYADMYFFDPQSRWIYVVTHEGFIGPYFFKAE